MEDKIDIDRKICEILFLTPLSNSCKNSLKMRKTTANSAQAQPEKGMRLCAER
jgi:hypothetical protein